MKIGPSNPLVVLLGLALGTVAVGLGLEKADNSMTRQQLQKAFQDGNYKDAYEGFRPLALDPQTDPREAAGDLNLAVQCLQQLNRIDETDALLEAAVGAHAKNWRLLRKAAELYIDLPHFGTMIAGKFHRGPHRGGGEVKNAGERDRVRGLQLMVQALPLATQDNDHGAVGEFLLSFSRVLLNHRGYDEAWRLQFLTDLGTLPDYEDGWGYGGEVQGTPVDEQGNPVFHHVPKSFQDAKTDGERWRWCLAQTAEFDPSRLNQTRWEFGNFLRHQFGVQTLAYFGFPFGREGDNQKDESGTYALHTLSDDETIARLATGIKRFKLPDEFNYIKIYRQMADESRDDNAKAALEQLAQIHENRRQYPKAAEEYRELLNRFDKSHKEWKDALEQIEGNWGEFEPLMTQPAGQGATVDFRFRNGKSVQFTAHEILVQKLLNDVKSYLKSRPAQIDGDRINIGDIGYRLIEKNQREYVGRQAASWTLELDPRPNHFDRRITVTTPLQKAGAYLVQAKMADGNTSFIVVWLNDTVIAKKPLDGKMYYYVADAAAGRPVAHANLEFFGFRQEWQNPRRPGPQQIELITKQFAEFTDPNGQVITDPQSQPPAFQWIITARTPEGRFAYMGFTGVWYGRRYDAEYNAVKVFTITDRPVYRPAQKVHYKFWVRHARYDQPDTSDFAGRSVLVEIYDPKNERVATKPGTLDQFGGIEGQWDLPAEATLGVYRLNVKEQPAGFLGLLKPNEGRNLGGGQFRVEEYKKPEFEVAVEAPKEPVMLGDQIEAMIQAKYYFGSPVTHAKVKYKVMRTSYDERWYPVRPWDWLYGPGYWWFAYDYPWYPGWREWGCARPIPIWWPHSAAPPEMVAEREVEIGPDGTVKVEIDTAVAKAIHPDQDHKYTITAEVVDQSRRTIVGEGTVLVARKPFKVYGWVDRGYYRVGDEIKASFSARTLDGRAVQGKGKLTLLEVTYKDAKPQETPLLTVDLSTNDEGFSEQRFKATRAGQYRLSYNVTDAKGHTIEGGYLFTITGAGTSGSDFRFDNLELVPQQAEYRPGETVNLMINTDRPGSTVLLFVRPTNGVYQPPKVLHLEGKSTVDEIAVVQRDMPNFFVEALSIADGKVYTVAKEIVVPPEKRVLSVEVQPSSESYRPGEEAKVRVKLTDFNGSPFVGSTVVAIYDKSVEYISGGSNVPEIKKFFWEWRRHHQPQTETSLQRYFNNLVPPGKEGMADLGIFGGQVPEESESVDMDVSGFGMMGGGMGGARGQLRERWNAVELSSADRGKAMPMAAPAPAGAVAESAAAPMMEKAVGMNAPAGLAEMVQPTIRKEFADTALWVGALETSKDGTAEVSLKMPENLTTWKIKVWGMGHGTKVGEGSSDVVTRKNLILRMQAPRFFVEKDEVVLSANVHNYLKDAKKVEVALELDGDVLEPMGDVKQMADIPANDEKRIDWRVKVRREGEAVVRMLALTDEESDAMETKFPAYVHGMLKMEAVSGALRPDQETGRFTINVPAERRVDQSRLEIRYSPTLAGAMVDALPYLVDYPYGCTEQTLSRFLPTVITQKILLDMHLNLKEIKDKRTNLNAQEIGEDQERARQWKRYDRNPVFDEDEVRRMVEDGVNRLNEMQLSDGGWGWFSGYGEYASAHMTAYVVHGLQIAQHNDVALVPGMLERGVQWLANYQDDQVRRLKNALLTPKKDPWKQVADNIDAFVYMVLVDAGVKNQEMLDFLYRDRTKLAVYGMAMFGLALEKQGQREKLDMILQNISQYVVQDNENQTAWLNLPAGFWWYWYGSENEAHAYYLKLLARTDPKGELTSRLVKYLLNNRKNATYWTSTRDTALCIEAMADFLRASGESRPEMTVEVWVEGKQQKAVEITPQNLFQFDNKFVLEGKELADGQHQIEIRKHGKGPLYYNGYLTNFTLEDYIKRAGLEIKVNRAYYRLKEVNASIKAAGSRGQVVDQRIQKYEREPLADLATLKSGDLVEIELEIDSKNDYEYLVFEDMKPAGFEPVDLTSGYNGNALGAYMEFRDNRVVFFTRTLARGKHSVSYRMRAETPGRFSALPTKGWAMYAPELKANSDEIKLRVED